MATQEILKDVHFPICGIDVSQSFDQQPNRPLPSGTGYARTTPSGTNVRSYEPGTGRARGGSRPGLVKYVPVAPVSGWVLQDISIVVSTKGTAVS